MIEKTEKDLQEVGAMGEAIEVIFNQFYLLSVWRQEAGESLADGFWSIDLMKFAEPVGILAGMDDGLASKPEQVGATLFSDDWSEVMTYIGELAAKHSEPKRI